MAHIAVCHATTWLCLVLGRTGIGPVVAEYAGYRSKEVKQAGWLVAEEMQTQRMVEVAGQKTR